MYTYMCVCVCVCVYVLIYIHIFIHILFFMQIYYNYLDHICVLSLDFQNLNKISNRIEEE